MNTFRVCENVTWERAANHFGESFFPEAALPELAEAGVATAVKRADVELLKKGLGGMKLNQLGQFGTEVFALRDNADLLVKLSYQSLCTTAINVALGAGFARQGTQLSTPRYLGYIAPRERGERSATLMSRVEGESLARFSLRSPSRLDDGGESPQAVFQKKIENAGSVALKNVGVDPFAVYWDLHGHNIFTGSTVETYRQALHAPLTIIDQECQLQLRARSIEESVNCWNDRSPFIGEQDPRNVAAEMNAERAWARVGIS